MTQIINRKASFNYNFLEKFEAGIVLTGSEIKAVRGGKVVLDESFVQFRDSEAFLINAHIGAYEKSRDSNSETRRSRKLLLNQKEINYLTGRLTGANLTVVPTRLYFKRNYAKIEVALAKGKKKYDKRETLRRRAVERDAEKILREDKLKSQQE